MKKRNLLSLTMAMGLMLTSCGAPEKAPETIPGSTAGNTAQEGTQEESQKESQKAENLPASQEYISSDGTYKVILLEGLTQTDMELPGAAMMGLEGGSDRTGFSGVSLGSSKANVPGNPGDMESLEDYADHITNMILSGSGVTVSWEDTDAPSTEESADSYFSVVIIGNSDDVEEAIQIISLEILDGASGQKGTTDFINGMTAVLDSMNGANIRETIKALQDMGADEAQLEALASQARQSLSDSWGVENAADLMEMADQLITGLHNPDALEFLSQYGGTNEPDRDAFDAKLKEQNLEEGTYISLLAAYDAWCAYGDSAIAAWDLSRAGTIMSFGYAAGYCTYEEAMDKMLEAAVKSQELFDSWADFNQSYLYGYSYWAEESLDDSEGSAAERAALISSMESLAAGPFAADWNMELKKEW